MMISINWWGARAIISQFDCIKIAFAVICVNPHGANYRLVCNGRTLAERVDNACEIINATDSNLCVRRFNNYFAANLIANDLRERPGEGRNANKGRYIVAEREQIIFNRRFATMLCELEEKN